VVGYRHADRQAEALKELNILDGRWITLFWGNYSALQEAICGRNPSIRTICCGQIADLLSNKDSLQAVRA
jgi:hypothetical protein